ELCEENTRLKQELFLVKSIHSTTSINSKTLLTNFYNGPSVSSEKQIDNDEKLDIVYEKVCLPIKVIFI
ncbi:unnamed protein product, partial [Adineta steineri]